MEKLSFESHQKYCAENDIEPLSEMAYYLRRYQVYGVEADFDRFLYLRGTLKSLPQECEDEDPELARDNPEAPTPPREALVTGRGDGLSQPPSTVAYELTLTTTKDDPYELRQILATVVSKPMFGVKSWGACFEQQKNGMPHIHAVLYTENKYMDVTKMKRYIPYRFECKRVRDLNKYLNYIQKDSGVPSILEYCARKGIDQFWHGTC